MAPPIVRVILYVENIPKVAEFYQRHFGMKPLPSQTDEWLELTSGTSGCNIALHQATSTQRPGAAIKIVFGVTDARAFVEEREKHGLKFGPIYEMDGFIFSNTKDPAGNSVQVSSRSLKGITPVK
jgi:predicted enzyme related to lactoylglutathione lyase